MEDHEIIELFWSRSESAIAETDRKYGPLCRQIAVNILHNTEDAEECVNDTYFGVWNAIPPQRPVVFSAFLCRIARNQALKKYEHVHAAKRNGNCTLPLSELEEMLVSPENMDETLDAACVGKCISDFLRMSKRETRNIFLRRYWFCDSIPQLAASFGMSESRVKSLLYRTRKKLADYLRKEGFTL